MGLRTRDSYWGSASRQQCAVTMAAWHGDTVHRDDYRALSTTIPIPLHTCKNRSMFGCAPLTLTRIRLGEHSAPCCASFCTPQLCLGSRRTSSDSMMFVLMMLQKSSRGSTQNGCSIWIPMFSTPISRKATTPATAGVSHPHIFHSAKGRKVRKMMRNRDVCLRVRLANQRISCMGTEAGHPDVSPGIRHGSVDQV